VWAQLRVGVRVKLRGEGFSAGWFAAELVGSDDAGGSRFAEGTLGNVQGAAVEEQPHSYLGGSEWAATHCIETGAGVEALAFAGPRAELLCVAAGRRVHLVMQHDRGITQRGGLLGAAPPGGLPDPRAAPRTRVVVPFWAMDDRGAPGESERRYRRMWRRVDSIPAAGDVLALAGTQPHRLV
jgi:hypothetical protein